METRDDSETASGNTALVRGRLVKLIKLRGIARATKLQALITKRLLQIQVLVVVQSNKWVSIFSYNVPASQLVRPNSNSLATPSQLDDDEAGMGI